MDYESWERQLSKREMRNWRKTVAGKKIQTELRRQICHAKVDCNEKIELHF